MKYRSEIDGLRALAVVPVIFFHAGWSMFSGGYVGVDVFFVISGYLITSIISSDIDQGNFSFLKFYERRARRILPALFAVMFFCIPFSYFFMLPSQLKDFSQSLIAVVFFASNVLFFRESGYFGAVAEEKPLLHTWSLSVEEQFYVVFPLLLLLIWRLGEKKAIFVIAAIALFSFASSEYALERNEMAAFFLSPFRFWELLAGSLAALAIRKYQPEGDGTISLLGLGLIFGPVFVFDETTPFPGTMAILPVLGSLLIILFCSNATFVGRVLSNKLMVGLGLVSYSAYLWHQPFFAFGKIIKPIETELITTAILIIASFVFAFLSYRFIEKPFRSTAPAGISTSLFLRLSILFIGIFLSFGIYGHLSDGKPERFQSAYVGQIGHDSFYDTISGISIECENAQILNNSPKYNELSRCWQSLRGEPDLILFGDSHAEHLYIGFAEVLSDRNIASYSFIPLLSNPGAAAVFDALERSKPTQIVIAIHYALRLNKEIAIQDFEADLSLTIDHLKKLGHDVAVVGDIPRFDFDPGYCKYSLPNSRYCSISTRDFQKQVNLFEPALLKISRSLNVPYFPLYNFLCGAESCNMTNGQKILYRDPNHLNIEGSKFLGDKVINEYAPWFSRLRKINES